MYNCIITVQYICTINALPISYFSGSGVSSKRVAKTLSIEVKMK